MGGQLRAARSTATRVGPSVWLPVAYPPAPGNLASNGSPACAAAASAVLLAAMPTSSFTAGGPAPAPTCVGGPVPVDARTGRHKQRYNDAGERLVAGCIPVRFAGGIQSAQHVEVCMITTTNGKGLVFPKGGWEDDETMEGAAKRETVEEAGVRGVLEDPLLGTFSFQGGKAVSSGMGGLAGMHRVSRCKAYIYVMHVAEELQTWPESKDRQRIWCNLRDASRLCKHSWMRDALHAFVRRRGWGADVLLDDTTSSTSTMTMAGGDFARSSAGEGSASSG